MQRRRRNAPRSHGQLPRDWKQSLGKPTLRRSRLPIEQRRHRRTLAWQSGFAVVVALCLGIGIRQCGIRRDDEHWARAVAAIESESEGRLATVADYISAHSDGRHIEDAHYHYARLSQELEGCATARDAWLRVLVGSDPERSAEACVRLGDCAFEAGDLDAALNQYADATRHAPQSPWVAWASLGVGRVAQARSDMDTARDRYRTALRNASDTQLVSVAARTLGAIDLLALQTEGGAQRTVVSGDSVALIASRAGLAIADVVAHNPWLEDPNRLDVGDVLRLPPKDLSLEVDVSGRCIRLMRRGAVVRYYPAAVGAPATPTPAGSFSVRAVRVLSADGPGPALIELNLRGFGIAPGAALDTLRTASTSGRVMIADEDWSELTRWARPGMPVRIVQSTGETRWAYGLQSN
ncbi:tetratricopeptide repeat protein [Candidatus Poribacteria bacterium]|nr:tetratricopeptide repeat protein [Candidatus Poribacteria bacterium]